MIFQKPVKSLVVCLLSGDFFVGKLKKVFESAGKFRFFVIVKLRTERIQNTPLKTHESKRGYPPLPSVTPDNFFLDFMLFALFRAFGNGMGWSAKYPGCFNL